MTDGSCRPCDRTVRHLKFYLESARHNRGICMQGVTREIEVRDDDTWACLVTEGLSQMSVQIYSSKRAITLWIKLQVSI